MDKYIGKMLGGRYEILEVVGVGGMAVVYRARCHVLNRDVAVKILKDEYAKDPDIRHRFSIESQAVAKLSHHNIVSVFDVGREGDADYIVMELMEGVTLKNYLQKKDHLSWQETLFFAQQIARALIHAHSRGIIHQDIKPQNIIILRDGTAKLTDFGIASFVTTQETRVVQEAIGSVHYISPEQAKGTRIDYRTDIYSLGVVMYEMLTGKLPFEGETALQVVMQHINTVPPKPSEVQSGIPQGMDEIVMHAMCANINARYTSADELYTDLERLKNNADALFLYQEEQPETQATQIISKEVQRAARESELSGPHEVQLHRRTEVAVREPETFWERFSQHPGMAATAAVVVFAVIAMIVAGILILTGDNDGEKQSVPDFRHMMIDDVLGNAEYAFFTVKEADLRQESDRPVGEILSQSVDPGRRVVQGTKVVLTVSAGGSSVDSTYSVPDFKDRSRDYVVTMLDKHQVTYQLVEENDDKVEADKVIRTNPEAGTLLPTGSTLTVYISKGKAVTQTAVPDLLGRTQKDAESMLSKAKLRLGNITNIESTSPIGTVVWQSVESGKSVDEGTAVSFQLSLGYTEPEQEPEPEPEPDKPPVNPDDEGDADTDSADPEQGTSQTLGSATIPVMLPTDVESAEVTIVLDGTVVHDEVYHTADGGTVMIPLTGTTGSHEVSIRIDGNAEKTYTTTFN